ASDAVLVAERLDGDDLFTRGDLAADHPIERAPGEDLLRSLRCHPRGLVLGKTVFLGGPHPCGDPFLQFLDGIAADGKLDDVKWHVLQTSDGVAANQSFDAAGT